MLDFTTQKKLLQPLLKKPENNNCADCDAVAPTWVSLDFGVFLCADCSGAHRGLGPTITRVRSTNLDKWQSAWIQNMRIGNTLLNAFWQADNLCATRKPRAGANLKQINRYVFLKYIKREWVLNKDEPHPLIRYKNGQLDISNQTRKKEPQSQKQQTQQVPKQAEVVVKEQKPIVKPKADVCLLDFDMEPAQAPAVPVNQNQPVQHAVNHEEDDFSEYTQAANTVQQEKPKTQNFVSFDALLNQQKQPQQTQQQPMHSQMPMYQNMQLHHPYNPHIAQNNLVYQGQYQHQQHPQMLHHQRSFTSVPHNGYHHQGMGYPSHQGPVSLMPQGQYW